ncbi:hypothetical protein BD410DRAFT_841879 [Rickenella mellea]|uniref:F-box domain-containing protein n=1 Tax=Rickenella mellea TaxID=50990 RepID=A0A4Y7PXU3_9AGAM|nr:hypothetical protein BD410DRAFT_841879 [Rickenella mellea]
MAGLVTIPFEVLSVLCRLLSLGNIASLRQVCKKLQYAISTDRMLWAHVLKRDVVDHGIPLVPYHRAFDLVDAPVVESWTRNALTLQRAYISTRSLTVDCFSTGVRAITWVKLIRGRWCLFASSNSLESRLSLLDTSSSCREICAEILLPGPVMDGQVEQNSSEIIVAVSVGSRHRFVQLFSLGISNNVVRIVEIHQIPGADRTLLLHGSILAVAVLDGDDSNPILIDWKSGQKCALKPRIDPTTLNTSPSVAVCLSMTIWKDFIVVVFTMEIRVYHIPSNGVSVATPHHSYVSADWTAMTAATFIREDGPDSSNRDGAENALLYIFLQSHDGDLYVRTINNHGESQSDAAYCDIPSAGLDGKTRFSVISMTSGLTGSKICLLFARHFQSEVPPGLMELTFTHRPIDADICADHYVLPDVNLPFLHFWPCIDFDDSRGVLIIGTSRGDLCISRFVPPDTLPAESVVDDLPQLATQVNDNCLLSVTLDLPLFHQHREYLHNDDAIPPQIVEQLIHHWRLPGDMIISAPGWSNDWHQFKNLKHWIMPSLRWGRLDPDFIASDYWDYSTVNKIRFSFGFSGEPCPVLYLEDNHDMVIFRVGMRPYILFDGQAHDDFPAALFRTSIDRLQLLLENQYPRLAPIDRALQYLTECDDHTGFGPNPKEWTVEQWTALAHASHEAGFTLYNPREFRSRDGDDPVEYEYEIVSTGSPIEFVWDSQPEW